MFVFPMNFSVSTSPCPNGSGSDVPSPWSKLSLYEYVERYVPGPSLIMDELKKESPALRTWRDFARLVSLQRNVPGRYLDFVNISVICDDYLGQILYATDSAWAKNLRGDWFKTSERFISIRDVLNALIKFYPEEVPQLIITSDGLTSMQNVLKALLDQFSDVTVVTKQSVDVRVDAPRKKLS